MTSKVSRDEIIDAAVSLLAAGGLPALGMRAIASAVGVQQSALYWHFDNKQELLGAVADRVVEPVAPPHRGNWAESIEVDAVALRTELLRYPDGAELVATALAFRLGATAAQIRFGDQLVGAGLNPQDLDAAVSVLVNFVLGYTTDEQQHRQAAALGAIKSDDADHSAASADRFLRGIRLITAGITAHSSQA